MCIGIIFILTKWFYLLFMINCFLSGCKYSYQKFYYFAEYWWKAVSRHLEDTLILKIGINVVLFCPRSLVNNYILISYHIWNSQNRFKKYEPSLKRNLPPHYRKLDIFTVKGYRTLVNIRLRYNIIPTYAFTCLCNRCIPKKLNVNQVKYSFVK